MMQSSIRRIVIAASVAKRRLLIFEIAGSTTPAAMLSRILPRIRSMPYCLKCSLPRSKNESMRAKRAMSSRKN